MATKKKNNIISGLRIKPAKKEAMMVRQSIIIPRYAYGYGRWGAKKQYRRFLQVRDEVGNITYYFWSMPNKGKMVGHVLFEKVKEITRQQARKVFNYGIQKN